MRLSQLPDRYLYYLIGAGTLEILNLISLWPPSIVSILGPIGILAALFLAGKATASLPDWSELVLTSVAKRQRDYFLHEFVVYVVVALGWLVVGRELFQQSLEDALYDTTLIIVFGYFAAFDCTLATAQRWYRQGMQQRLDTFRLIPVSVTLKRAVLSLLIAIALVLVTSALRLYGGLSEEALEPKRPGLHFGAEILVFLGVLGFLLLRIVRNYTFNVHFVLESQLKVIRDAQAGDYSQTIPLLTQNEFGLMGTQLNRLIEYVRQRQDVENLLKRVVSPDIMEKLLSTDTEQLKRGEERDVAILFCDIRGFTEMSESTSAADVILFLNSFFAELSELVSRNHGTINKFMGDAVLAVFGAETDDRGMDSAQEAIDAAMNTANEITMRVRQMRLPNGGSPATGTGIHFGRVVAGTIGSEQRYEYTFLGDAVNTASRLQGLSKRLGYPIIVSAEAYAMLSGYLRAGLVDLGQHMVRGKAEALHIYGGPPEAAEAAE